MKRANWIGWSIGAAIAILISTTYEHLPVIVNIGLGFGLSAAGAMFPDWLRS